jgi:hypothetical protein
VNPTDTVQLDPGAREPQLLLWLNTLAFVPLKEKFVISSVAPPAFVTVSGIAEAAVPDAVAGKEMAPGESEARGPGGVEEPPPVVATTLLLLPHAVMLNAVRTATPNQILPMPDSPISIANA